MSHTERPSTTNPLSTPNGFAPTGIPGSGSGMDQKIKKKYWTPKRIIGLAAILLFVGFVGWGFWTMEGGSRLRVEAEKITISEVTAGEFQEFIAVIGTVQPLRTVYLDAVEGGRVEQRFIEEGSLVEEGDAIIRLTNNNLQLDLLNREAQFYETMNYLRNARLAMEQNTLSLRQQMTEIKYNVQRTQRLIDRRKPAYEKGLVSEEEYQQIVDENQYWINRRELTLLSHQQDSLLRRSQVEQLESSVDRMQRNLDVVRQNLENLVVKAPITGQLTSLNAEIGESIASGQRLGQVDQLDGFKVTVPVDEHYLARISPGQRGIFPFAGSSYELIIRKVYPEVQNGRFEVEMVFSGAAQTTNTPGLNQDPELNQVSGITPDGLRRGQTVRIRLELGDLSDAILLPRGGFYNTTGGNWIYVVNSDGTEATKRTIRINRQSPQYYEVSEGLEPGERVVTSSYDTFGDVDKLILE